jgi:hypothetical protein
VSQPLAEKTANSLAQYSPIAAPLSPTPPPSGSGYAEQTSGSGYIEKSSSYDDDDSPFALPAIPGVQWEWKSDGSGEAWHTPRPNAPRRERTYLKRVGKRLLAGWEALPEAERRAVVAAWIAERLAEKGISHNG